jgi:isobutyryl-CoA mutase
MSCAADPGLPLSEGVMTQVTSKVSTDATTVIPSARAGYLGEIAGAVRGYREQTERQVAAVRPVQRLADVRAELFVDVERTLATVEGEAARDVAEDNAALIKAWPAVVESCSGDERVVRIRDSLRRPDGRRPGLQPPAGRRGVLRGRRPEPRNV